MCLDRDGELVPWQQQFDVTAWALRRQFPQLPPGGRGRRRAGPGPEAQAVTFEPCPWRPGSLAATVTVFSPE